MGGALMQATANSLLSLLAGGSSVLKGAIPAGAQGQPQKGQGINAFAALVSKVQNLAPTADTGAEIAQVLSPVLRKLEQAFEKLTQMLESMSETSELPEGFVASLEQLKHILTELDTALGGQLFQTLEKGLLPQVALDESGVKELASLPTPELIEVLEKDVQIPELIATVAEILNVLPPVVQKVVQAAVSDPVVQSTQVVTASPRPQLAVVQELNTKRTPITNGAVAAHREVVSPMVAEATHNVPVVEEGAGPTLPAPANSVAPPTDKEALEATFRDLGSTARDVLRAFVSQMNTPNQSAVFKDMLSLMTPVAETTNEALTVVSSDIPGISTERAVEQQVSSVQHAQPTKAAESTNSRFVNALLNQVRAVDVQEGVTKVELTPRGLGNIELEMKTNSDGSLSVVVRAENAHVLNSLREERDLLAQVIGQAGGGSVEFENYDDGADQQQGEAGGFSDGGDTAETVSATADSMESDAKIGGGTLDLMT